MSNIRQHKEELEVKAGKLLLAQPFMMDPFFRRSVIFLCEHNEEGSLGFIINKKLDMKINELVADFPEIDAPLYYGGPVQNDTLHYLHNSGDLLDDSKKIGPKLYWGGDFEKLKFLIQSKLILPHNIRFFIGYSGWSTGQLEEEMVIGSWLTAEMHPNYLFKTKARRLWQQVMYNKGSRYTVISQMPEMISWN